LRQFRKTDKLCSRLYTISQVENDRIQRFFDCRKGLVQALTCNFVTPFDNEQLKNQNAERKHACLTAYAHFDWNMNGSQGVLTLYRNPCCNRENYNGSTVYYYKIPDDNSVTGPHIVTAEHHRTRLGVPSRDAAAVQRHQTRHQVHTRRIVCELDGCY